MRIRIPKWSDFQQYKDRRPDWIKLYRHLLENRHWHGLSGDAAKLLVEVWLIASESKDGTIDVGTDEVAWRLRKESGAVAAWLLELERGGFVELSVQDQGTKVTLVQPTDVARTGAYGSVQTDTQRRGEENFRGEGDLEKKHPVGVEKLKVVEHTIGGCALEAHRVLGMGLWGDELSKKYRDTRRIITDRWVASGVTLEAVYEAIHGLRVLVDRGDVEWLADRKGKPLDGLEVLTKSSAVVPGPDGTQLRSLFDASRDAYHSHEQRTKRGPTSSPKRLHVEPPDGMSA